MKNSNFCIKHRILTSVFLSFIIPATANSQVIISEDFDDYTYAPYSPGSYFGAQAHTGLKVFAGREVDAVFPGWTGSGIHHSHAVDLDPSAGTDFALQLYNGNSGGQPSQANSLTSTNPIAANANGFSYRVSFDAAPSVWNAGGQATTSADGIKVEILRSDNSVLADYIFQPGAWSGQPDAQDSFQRASFSYLGDGTGDVRIRLVSSPVNTGKFGGAVDNLEVEGHLIATVDIKPGGDQNSVNLCLGGAVPVAVHGSALLDVTLIDETTLRFAEASVKVVGKKDPRTLCKITDVNNDGIDDLVCHFITADIAGVDGESSTAMVNGELTDGPPATPFAGADTINIVKDTCS